MTALADAGLLPAASDADGALTPDLASAIHRFLARSEAQLFMVQIDDLAGEASQANMPGTTDRYPNWSRRIRVPLAELAQFPSARGILDAVAAERPPAGPRELKRRLSQINAKPPHAA